MAIEKLEVEISAKNNIKPGLNQARDDIKGFNQRVKSDTAIQLSINSATIKKQLDDVKAQIKSAKASGDFNAEITLTANAKVLQNQLTQADRELRNFLRTGQKDVSVLGKLFDSVKVKALDFLKAFAGVFAIERIVNFGAESFKAFTSFEKGLANINTVARVSQKELSGLGNEIKKVAEDYGIAKDELLQTAFNIASAGVQFQNIPELLALSSQVALSASTDTTTAFNGIIAVIKKYGLDLTESTKIADLFFKTNELGQTTVGDLAAAIQNLSTTAPLAGISLEELFGVYSTLTGVTGDANQVTTQLNGTINALAAPTSEASKLFKQLGIEVGANAIEQKGLAGVSKEIYEATGGNLEIIRKLIPEVEATKLVVALATTQYDKFKTSTDLLADSQGSLKKALEEITKTTDFQLKVQQQKWDNFKISVGSTIKSIGGFLFDFVTITKSVFNIIGAIVANGLNVFVGLGIGIAAGLTDIGRILKQFALVVPDLFKAALNNLPAIFAKAFNAVAKTLLGSDFGGKISDALGLKDLVGQNVFEGVKLPEVDFKNFKSSVNQSLLIAEKLNGGIEEQFNNIKDTLSGKNINNQVFDKIIIDSQKFGSDLVKTSDENAKKILDSTTGSASKAAKEQEKILKDLQKKKQDAIKQDLEDNDKLYNQKIKTQQKAEKDLEDTFKKEDDILGKLVELGKKSTDIISEFAKNLKQEISGLTAEINDIGKSIDEVNNKQAKDLGARAIEIQKQLLDLSNQGITASLASGIGENTLNSLSLVNPQANIGGQTVEDLLEVLNLQKELELINSNITNEQREQAEALSQQSEAEKILAEAEEKRNDLLQQQAILEEQKSIAKSVRGGSEITIEESGDLLKAFYTDEKGQLIEIQNQKNIQYAQELQDKKNNLDSQLALIKQDFADQLTELETYDGQRQEIESKYTNFLGGEIEKRKVAIDSLIAKMRELESIGGSLSSATSDLNNGVTGVNNTTTDNSQVNVNMGGVNVNNNADINYLATQIAKIISGQRKTNQ